MNLSARCHQYPPGTDGSGLNPGTHDKLSRPIWKCPAIWEANCQTWREVQICTFLVWETPASGNWFLCALVVGLKRRCVSDHCPVTKLCNFSSPLSRHHQKAADDKGWVSHRGGGSGCVFSLLILFAMPRVSDRNGMRAARHPSPSSVALDCPQEINCLHDSQYYLKPISTKVQMLLSNILPPAYLHICILWYTVLPSKQQ